MIFSQLLFSCSHKESWWVFFWSWGCRLISGTCKETTSHTHTHTLQTNQFPPVARSGCISNPGVPVDRILLGCSHGAAPTLSQTHLSSPDADHRSDSVLIYITHADYTLEEHFFFPCRLSSQASMLSCNMHLSVGWLCLLLTHQTEVSALCETCSAQEQDTAPEATDCVWSRHIGDI